MRFSAWIFGDTVIRARVGDRIKFSTTNRSDEPAPGIQLTAAPMMHSMDFHSAMGADFDMKRAPARSVAAPQITRENRRSSLLCRRWRSNTMAMARTRNQPDAVTCTAPSSSTTRPDVAMSRRVSSSGAK